MAALNKTTKRLMAVFAVAATATFVFGVIIFNWYISTDDFAAQLETMRSKLKQRGIKFGSVSVGRLGQIEITDFKVDLGDLGEISLASLSGRIEFSSLLSGEVKTILNVTQIVDEYLQLRFKKKIILKKGGDIQFSFGGDIRALRSGTGLNGDIYFDDCSLYLEKIDTTVSIKDAAIPVTTPGPVISFPNVEVFFDERRSVLSGSIRNILRSPEFVDATLSGTKAALLTPVSKAIRGLNNEELSRKVSMDGNAEITVSLNGSVLSPQVAGKFSIPDYLLDFRGTHRNIRITFDSFQGDFELIGTLDKPHFTFNLKSKKFLYDYLEVKASHMPHLYFRGDEFVCRAEYKDKVLSFQQLVASVYGGLLSAKLNVNFNTSPLNYAFAVVGNKIDLGDGLADLFDRDSFFDAKIAVFAKGEGKTLLLERMLTEGTIRLSRIELAGLPNQKAFDLPVVKRVFPGVKFADALAEFKIDHGFFDLMKLKLTGDDMDVDAFGHIDILNLDVQSGAAFLVKDSFIRRNRGLARELPDKRLETVFSGRLMMPQVVYIPATVIADN